MEKSEKLEQVLEMLGKKKLTVNEQWMFDNYWDNSEYELKKDVNGKLWVHQIDQTLKTTQYFLFAKGVEQFNVNKESLGIGDDRAVYYSKSIGKHRLYRSGYPVSANKDFELLTFTSKKKAEAEALHTNKVHNDNFVVREL